MATTTRLLIGPLLRRVVGSMATIWVETSGPATVRVEADGGGQGEAPTFTAYGHHYALVVVRGLRPGAVAPYRVLLNGAQVWPQPEAAARPSVIRTRAADDTGAPVRLVFGSCRETTQRSTARRLPPDALDAYARRLMTADPAGPGWPDLIMLLGDQVYADGTSPKVRELLARRRGHLPGAPADQVVTFEEYTLLYLESWRDPEIRWLLSTVPSVMIFDDHEIVDDWNSSAAWRADIRRHPWWNERITSGLASYWVYQHLGNLAPDEVAADPVHAKVTAAEDATAVLHDFAASVDAEPSGPQPRQYRWSLALDVGRTRVVVLDNRCSRVLDPAHRAMLPPDEWAWFAGLAGGDYDHLVVGSSLPWLLAPAIHHMEAFSERLAGSRPGRIATAAEGMRRFFDLEHWAAFQRSFADLADLFRRLGTGPASGAGPAPASISVLSGDVHHSYVARADLGPEVTTPVHQLTCSPFHNDVPGYMRPALRLGWDRALSGLAGALTRPPGAPRPAARWRKLTGPYFGNAVATLLHAGRSAHVRIEGTTEDGELVPIADTRLAG